MKREEIIAKLQLAASESGGLLDEKLRITLYHAVEALLAVPEALPQWRLLPQDSKLPDGPPTYPGTTLYAFDDRGTWVYECPALPGPGER